MGSVSPQMASASSWSGTVQGNVDASYKYSHILESQGIESCKEWTSGGVNACHLMTVLSSPDISGIVYVMLLPMQDLKMYL